MSTTPAIVGFAQLPCAARHDQWSIQELVFEAARGALDDAGMERSEIDSIVLAGHDLLDGRGISSMLTAAPAGAADKDEIRLAEDGAMAMAMAQLLIRSGHFRACLIVSWSKVSEVEYDKVSTLGFEPFTLRPLGINEVMASALRADSYLARYPDVSGRDAALVVAKNRANGARNPLAQLQTKVSAEEAAASAVVASPLRELDLPTLSDGGCALVLTSEEVARASGRPAAYVHGVGWEGDSYYLGDRDLAELTPLAGAARRAYRAAGIDNPAGAFDVIEFNEADAFEEIMAYEALGLAPAGKGAQLVRDGTVAFDGRLPVNPSGGALCGAPGAASGLYRVIEAARQVTGRADGRQVPGARRALAAGMNGIATQSACVVILGNEPRG